MKSADIKKIRKKMEKTLDSARFEHTLGVTYTAACLAMRYDADITKAQIAGLLHDCAKCLTNEKRIFLCKHNIQMNEAELKNPQLLHAKVGSFLAMEEFDIHDQDIINAILNHTTGRPDMSLLEKIIYIADYIEPMRYKASRLPEIRKIAFQDLDETMYEILKGTLEYLDKKGNTIDPMTLQAYEYFAEAMKQKKANMHI